MSANMEHQLAEKTGMVERYLLGELTHEESSTFEAHFFDCPVCAEQIRTGFLFVDNARAVLREEAMERSLFPERSKSPARRDWLAWLRPPVLVPSFAAVAMGVIVGYQNLVTLPALQQPQVLSATVVAPVARDGGVVIAVDRHRPFFNVNFAVDSQRVYPNYSCRFERQTGGPAVLDLESGPRDVSSFTLGVLLPASKFPDGTYTMTVRPAGETSVVIQRYTFTVRTGGSD